MSFVGRGTGDLPGQSPCRRGQKRLSHDVKGAEIDLHRLEEILEGHALLLGFHPVNVGVQLRDVDSKGGKDAIEAWSLIALANEACTFGKGRRSRVGKIST